MSRILKRVKPFLLIVPIVFSLSSCVYLVVGGIGALGGYVVSPDTVEGITENDNVSVYESAEEIISIMGTIDKTYSNSGMIQAQISGAKVNVTIVPLSDNATKITVKARKYHMPRIAVAQDVFVKVMTYLNE